MRLDSLIVAMVCLTVLSASVFVLKINRPNKKLPVIVVNAMIRKKRSDGWRNGTSSPLIKEFYADFVVEGHVIEIKISYRKDYEKLRIGDFLSHALNSRSLKI